MKKSKKPLIAVRNLKAPKRKRVMPRVIKASGSAMPGIQFTDSALLQEIEDLDYISRIKKLK